MFSILFSDFKHARGCKNLRRFVLEQTLAVRREQVDLGIRRRISMPDLFPHIVGPSYYNIIYLNFIEFGNINNVMCCRELFEAEQADLGRLYLALYSNYLYRTFSLPYLHPHPRF